MTKLVHVLLCSLLLLAVAASAGAAEQEAWMHEAHVDVGNRAALQRGAKYFVNYCLGCHSARYVRYSRVGTDLGIDPQLLATDVMFAADKPQETMEIAMPPADAKRWFGRTPPDASLLGRSRGPDWIYNYLRSFYVDKSKPWGVNNLALPNTAMPDVLWELQGMQHAVFREETDAAGNKHSVFERFEPATSGRMTSEEYDGVARDIATFLAYIGEPVQLERRSLGLRVIGYLGVLFVLAYALKKEFWKDLH
jgi:ubiquinol-cytochrome c reductase cytochrome c1 subunit